MVVAIAGYGAMMVGVVVVAAIVLQGDCVNKSCKKCL